MKKFLAVAAAALMAATAVGVMAGCKDPEHTISVLLLVNENEKNEYREYFKDYQEDYLKDLGYKIDFTGYEEGDYYERLESVGQSGNYPDIFYVRPNELLVYKNQIIDLQEFADTQDVADLSKINEGALNMFRFNPETSELGNPNDDLYAFPKDLSTQMLGYNKTLLELFQTEIKAAGYEMPWEKDFSSSTYTWNDYKNIVKIISDNAESKKAQNNNKDIYACDIPSIEVLTNSFGGKLIDLSNGRAEGKIQSMTDNGGALQKAIEYQRDLIQQGSADYELASYANFTSGKVVFYGLVSTWEIAEYNQFIGEGKWDVMPWPTVDGSTNWKGVIGTAGYVVSKKAASMAKGDAVKELAVSFLSARAQDRFVNKKISLPLIDDNLEDYISDEKDGTFFPAHREYFVDVTHRGHGVLLSKYSTYDSLWLDQLTSALSEMYKGRANGVASRYNSTKWEDVISAMQEEYDNSKNS